MALKILLQGNAPFVSTGYGNSNSLLVQIFQSLHHSVAIASNYGLMGAVLKMEGVEIFPGGYDLYGNDIIDAHAVRSGADLVISNVDVFVLRDWGKRSFKWLPITPIAEDPLTVFNKNALQGAVDIVATSRYGQQVLNDADILANHIYLPVETEFFCPMRKAGTRRAFGWPDDVYVMGHVGMNRGYRKGMDLLLQAFQLFVSEHPKSLLYIHTDPNSPDGLNLMDVVGALNLQRYVRFPTSYDAFIGVNKKWMLALYNSLDLYVQPALNEGQAMPVWEASACGTPVVGTNATAITEAMEGADAIAVEPTNRVWLQTGGWGYEVSPDSLALAMEQAYRKYGHGCVSAKSRDWAIQNVSMASIAHQWHEQLTKVEKMVRFQPAHRPWVETPHIVQVSTTVHNCGIGAYTRHLMASTEVGTKQECVDILTLKNTDQIPDCDLVHVHFEYAISPNQTTLRQVLSQLKQRGTKVVMTYHTINPQLIQEHLNEGLVDIAIVHWLPKGMEVDKRIWILGGMGCPSFTLPYRDKMPELREQYGFGLHDTIISTFGFAAPGRGHYEVLEELAPQLVQNPHVKLQIIAPANAFNEEGKIEVHQRIEEIAAAYHIGPQIHLVPEFVSDLEVLNRLFLSNVGFLYIGFETGSSSAAIRFFISARLPLVVTDSDHFGDVRRGVVRTTGANITDFSRKVWELAHDQVMQFQLRMGHELTYKQNVWPQFAQKCLAIYKSALTAPPKGNSIEQFVNVEELAKKSGPPIWATK